MNRAGGNSDPLDSDAGPAPASLDRPRERGDDAGGPLERFAARRAEMIDRQLRTRDIRDPAVLDAMAVVPRERFVAPELAEAAYADEALGIEAGQTISQPYIVARMTELLAPRPGMRVLEVGTGSGYQAAVLATIGCSVYSVERHAELATAAERRLRALGFSDQVRITTGDGTLGLAFEAPFEGIIVTAAAPDLPRSLLAQLADGGRLVIPVGERNRQDLKVVTRHGDGFEVRVDVPCVFVPLVGEEGYTEGGPQPGGWLL